jgi:Domain of unknown function (DUF4440)
MKITIIGGLFMVFIVFTIQAQPPRNAADSAQTEILQLTGDWNDAIIHRDSLVLDKILASDYSLNGLVNRAIWMSNTFHHIVTDTLKVIGQLHIIFYGQVAKSEGRYFWKASFDGKPRINGNYDVTDIWIRRDGRWQVLLRMSLPSVAGK